MRETRRDFLRMAGGGVAGMVGSGWLGNFWSDAVRAGEKGTPTHPLYPPGEYHRIDAKERRFHISSCSEQLKEAPELPEVWRDSGVTDVWVALWFYGYFPFPWDEIDHFIDRIKGVGLTPHMISVPFCHGGGALDPRDPNSFPNIPPEHWKTAKRFNGSENWGFSYHSPADEELLESARLILDRFGPTDYFLDDDFRFAQGTSEIGGCVCEECRSEFLRLSGLPESRWEELVGDWKETRDTPLLRSWLDYTCDKLTACFRKTAEGVPEVDLGIMMMYMGSERAGIRPDDYRGHLIRVGEFMFGDNWFDKLKNKTMELFSSLFHSRFTDPGRRFSETTVYPEGSLSATNMAAKLAISTFSDVRNTMFMSGLRSIPVADWPILAPRIRKEREFHRRLIGRRATGPFKHFWGLADRYMASDNAFSLFLATGVPFEVCDSIPRDGWTFLGDASAAEMDRGALTSGGSKCMSRIASTSGRFDQLSEDLDSLYQFRRPLLPDFRRERIPYVEEETPVILGWFPTSDTPTGAVSGDLLLLWNPDKTEEKSFTVRVGESVIPVTIPPLETALLEVA